MIRTFLDDAVTKARVLKAIQDLAHLVGNTLGPGGRPILMEQENRPPLSTKDGVTVARNYQASGSIERVVTDAAKEVCERTVRQVGDGTTTAIVLASALVEHGQKTDALYSPQQLCRDLDKLYRDKVKPSILHMAKPIRNLPMEEARAVVYKVALISANHDEEIAKAVAEAVEAVGEDGMVTAEEGAGAETQVKVDPGFPFGTGLSDLGGSASQAFVNRQDYSDCLLEGAAVLLYDGDINEITTLIPIMERHHSTQPLVPLVVFAHRFGDQVLKMMAQNFRRNTLKILPMITARIGQAGSKSQFLYDLSSYVGGTIFDAQGKPLAEAHPQMLGFCESIKAGMSETIIQGKPDQTRIESRIAELKTQMAGASEFDQEKIRYRIGRLTGAIATIYAGGTTSLEAKERHARVVDAVSAVRSAMEFGVVPGGGMTLAIIAETLADTGAAGILKKSLVAPLHRICLNAGYPPAKPRILDGKIFAYDVLGGEYVEWYDGGIMDPAKVVMTALESALSVSQLLMTLGGVIAAETPSEEKSMKSLQQTVEKALGA